MATKPARSIGTTLIVAVIALILGISAIVYAAYVQSTVTSQVNSATSSLPQVNQQVQTRNVTIEWSGASSSGQDRFLPEYIVINQGDTVALTFISNDTGDGHTFTIKVDNSRTFQLNDSIATQKNFITGTTFSGAATGCLKDGNAVNCNTVGHCYDSSGAVAADCQSPTTASARISSTGSFTSRQAGTYDFYCVYHKSKGMFGYLIVLPNSAFTG